MAMNNPNVGYCGRGGCHGVVMLSGRLDRVARWVQKCVFCGAPGPQGRANC